MKAAVSLLLVAVFAAPQVFAQQAENDRIRAAGQVIGEILNVPDNIPQNLLDKAKCVIILPSVMKLAFGVGGSYGRGVMTCRSGRNFNGHWGPPALVALG